MKSKFSVRDKAEASVVLQSLSKSGIKLWGRFDVECYRKDELVWREHICNIVTDEGLNRILNVILHGTTQTNPWYCCLIESNTDPVAGMTYDVPVYTESVAYDEAAAGRPIYNEAESTAKSTTNSGNKAVFTINATKTIYGASLVSVITAGDHTGGANNVLLCYAKFSLARAVLDDDIINLTYTMTAADDNV